jgi:glycosyltransferase involved in cell wall biosynthesis/MoaA/NifB/PqqE/SkfB family radical SAM enzyme
MDAKKNLYNIKKLENNLRNKNIFIDNLPTQIHFLMIDKCNAKCIMCGGNYFHSKSQRKITLDKFKKMASNLQLQRCSGIVLAGAGDPLLNRDLVPIIQFVREQYPHIRISVTTNGIALTKKLSESFIDNHVGVVNVSINSATRKSFDRIMQVDCFDKVCENTKNLVDLRNRVGRKTRVQFSCAINRLNIEELPLLVELSRDLGVDSINVMYCRFYPEKIRHLNVTHEENLLHDKESLFYHQELSDRMIKETEVLAKRYGIGFSHEPLFQENASPQSCIWPVMELMVGFDGEIYPCGGSEVHLKEKVEKGVYDFGNALTETIDSFWNNEYYLALRISSKKGEICLTPECRCCANTLSHKEIGAHIMEWDKSTFGEEKQSDTDKKEIEIKCTEDTSPQISVIVPTYNRPEMLTEALESILKQTFKNFEIVVVNDAGIGVEDVISKLNTRKNIAYVFHPKNRGLAAARNTGIRVARGKYIALLDDDDLFYPNHLEIAMGYLSEETPVIYTDATRATYDKYNASYRLVGKKVPYSIDFERNKLLVGNIAPVNCFVFEREKGIGAGLFDETLTTLEDWDFWIRLSERCTFKHIAKVTAQVNWRTDGTTMTSSRGAEFEKNRDRIYKCYQEQINQISDIESILNEFDKIWKEDNNPTLPLVSIVVLTCNQIAYTKKCMESIIKHTNVPFELIVVDNGSTDGTVEYLESELTKLISEDRLLVIKNNENFGFAKGNNQGIAASRAGYVMLLNNDVVVTPEWLSIMMACAEKSPMTGIVGPKSNCVSGPQLVENVSYDTNKLNGLEIFVSEFAEKNSGKATTFNRLVGFCMLIKRAVIDKIGGLDGRYGLGNFEDNDFCLRALLAGYELYIAEDCFVHHFGNRTFIGEQIDYGDSLLQNWEIFKKKWEIPKDLPYGSYYDFTNFAKDGFIYSKHYSPLKEKSDLQVAKEQTTRQVVSNPMEDKYHQIQQMLVKGKKKEARGALEQLLLANPDFALAHNDLGVLIFQDGDTAGALKHYESAVALQPININFIKNLADFYFVELGRVEDALKLYNKALYINPKDIETLLIIGHICVSLKKFDDAKVFYNKVLQIDPLNADARQMLDKLLNHEQGINQNGQISIIIPTSGRQKNIENCLESIEKHTLESYEIIFVDNGSSKGTLKWLKSCINKNSNYQMVKCSKDANFAGIYNKGIKASKGEYFLLLSNDVVVTRRWLSNMLQCMKSTPDEGVVGPMSNHSRGLQKVLTAGNVSLDRMDEFAESFMTKNGHRRISTLSLDGFCLLFRRDLVEEIGLFDEQFDSGGYEDEDFCLRAVLEGHKNYIAGDVYVHQLESRVTSKNRKYFNTKWNQTDANVLSGKRILTLKAVETGKEVSQKGHTESAVEILLEGIRLLPDDKRPYDALAEILLHAKKYKDAIDVLNEMPPDDPDQQDARKFELMGYCKEGMDLDKEAIDHADCALSIKCDSSAAHNLKGILAFKQGNNSSARDFFNRAIELDPGCGEPYTNLGAMLWDKNPDKALDLFERGFILSPASPDIVTNYHSAVLKLQKFERAEPVFQDAGLLYPNDKNIKYKLIDILIKQEKHKEAIHQIEEAMVLYGTDDGILSAALKVRDLLGPKEIGKSKDKKNTVSLCMIVKNEEEHLAKCLRSVKPVVDEMIIVDTGSTDRTKDVARIFGAKVYTYEWADNFAEARNFSISKACGSWTFHLDADEVISFADYDVFRKLARLPASKQVAFLFGTRNYTMDVNRVGWTPNDGKYEKEECGTGWTLSDKVRLFRRDRRIRFDYPVHELAEPSLKKAKVALKRCTIPIHHYGTLNKGKSEDKSEVYYRIGLKKLDEMGDDTVALPALREMAIQAEILGKHDKAVELWERFIAIEPHVPEAFINMGIAYCSLGKFEDVLETAKKAMKLAPDMKEAHYNYALGKLNTGDSGEAVFVLEKLLERLDEYLPARFVLAAAYCCKGEKGKGIKILEDLKKTSIGAGLPIRCHNIARGFVSSHRYDYALGILDAAIESKNSNKDVLELYSQCLKITCINEKKGTSGITFCEKWKSIEDKNEPENKVIAMDMVKQAKELNQNGQTNNAIEAALKAIGCFPRDKRPYYFLAQTLINTKQYKDAFDVLNEMPKDEKDVKRLELVAYCKEGMKQYDEAKDYANQALSLNRVSAPALNLKGMLAYNQDDSSKAEVYFNQAIESDPGYGEAYTNLGAIRWKESQDEALNLFEKGFILTPAVPDIVSNYHTAASALGEFKRAEGVFQEAGSLYPNNKMIKYQLIDVFIKQEKNQEAMHQIEEAIALFGVDDGILSAALKIRDLLGPKQIDKTKVKKNTVSLCMIVKNEEKHLARCLNSVKLIVDEMIVVDTGSNDGTKEIAKAFGAKVYDYKWTDDFSKARNFSISKASGRWNLIMDADETISSLDYNKFKRIIERSKLFAYQFTTRNYTLLFNMIGWNANDGKYVNENAGVGWTPSDKVRLFPNKPGVRFEYPIHELIEPSLKKAGLKVKKCKIPIHHYGRLDQGETDKKGEIYYQIGRKKLNEMKDNANALLELAIQAGILGKYEESIELWERFINMKPEMPMAFVNMGAMYTKLGKYDQAVSAAAKALKIEPNMKEAHYNYAFSKVHLGQAKEAISVLEKLLSQVAEYPPAQFLLTVAYCLEAREAKWLKGFEKLRLTMGPGLAVACHEFAKGLVSAKRPDFAVTLLEAAIKSKNRNKEIDELYCKCLEMIDAHEKTGTMGDF